MHRTMTVVSLAYKVIHRHLAAELDRKVIAVLEPEHGIVQELDVVLDLVLHVRDRTGDQAAAGLVTAVKECNAMAAGGSDAGAVHPRRASPDDRYPFLGPCMEQLVSRCHVLETGHGIHRALDMPAGGDLVEAPFLVADAGDDVTELSRVGFPGPVRVRQERPRQHHHVALVFPQGPLCQVRIAELTHRHDGNRNVQVGNDPVGVEVFLHDAGHFKVYARGHGVGGMEKPPVVIAPEIDVEYIDAGLNKVLHVVEGHIHGALVPELFKELLAVHSVAVGLLQRQGEVDAVHDRIAVPGAAPHLLDEVYAEGLPVPVPAQASPVEGRVRHLLEEVSLVSVEIDAVQAHLLRVSRVLAGVLYEPGALAPAEGAAEHQGHVEAPVP